MRKPEPAVIVALVTAYITLFTAFGLHLTAAQVAAITGAVQLTAAFVVRYFVTPVRRAKRAPAPLV